MHVANHNVISLLRKVSGWKFKVQYKKENNHFTVILSPVTLVITFD